MRFPLRVGILGTGDGAKNHARAFVEGAGDVVLWSVCGRDPERTAAFAADHGATAPVSWHTDADAFLRDPDLAVVIVASTDAQHLAHATAAMRAGKHVLVEKPLALSSRDARDLVQLAQYCGVRLGVGYHLRHHAGHRLLRERIDGGGIGMPAHVHLEWSTQSMPADNWRATSTEGWWALASLGTHAIDLVSFLTDLRVSSIHAEEGLRTYTGRDERVTMLLRLGIGVTATVRVSVTDNPVKLVRCVGSAGAIECRNTLGGRGTGEILLPDGSALAFDPVNPYAAQLTAFARAVETGREPEADGTVGLHNVEWLERAGASLTQNNERS